MEIQKALNELKSLKIDYNLDLGIDFEKAQAEIDHALQLQQTGVSTCFLEDVTDDVFNMGYKQVSCCKIAPITDENYCPKCDKKILK